jgi:hypothetical protein
MQRPLNSATLKPNIARDGAAKSIVAAPVKPGMTRQTSGDLHPYLHGQTVDDEVPAKSHTSAPPIHSATPSRALRGEHVEGLGSAVLVEASTLGKKA